MAVVFRCCYPFPPSLHSPVLRFRLLRLHHLYLLIHLQQLLIIVLLVSSLQSSTSPSFLGSRSQSFAPVRGATVLSTCGSVEGDWRQTKPSYLQCARPIMLALTTTPSLHEVRSEAMAGCLLSEEGPPAPFAGRAGWAIPDVWHIQSLEKMSFHRDDAVFVNCCGC